METNPFVVIPHFAVPFHFHDSADGVHAHVQEQDSYDEIRDCVENIVRYARGERPEAPDFGITQQEFAQPVDKTLLYNEIQYSEPRVDLLISSQLSAIDEMVEQVTVGIVVSENAEDLNLTGGSGV